MEDFRKNKMYKHRYQESAESVAKEESVSLHDCRATRMSVKGRKLSFTFSDGFNVIRNSSNGIKCFYISKESILSLE